MNATMYVVLCIQKMNKDILNGVELCERMCGRRGLDSIAGARQKIARFTRLAIFRRSRSLTALAAPLTSHPLSFQCMF